MVLINCILLYILVLMLELKGLSGKGYDFFYFYIVKLFIVGIMLIVLIFGEEIIDICYFILCLFNK